MSTETIAGDPDWRRLGRLALAFALSIGGGTAARAAEITIYEHVEFRGASRTFDRDVSDLRSMGWNDKASSLSIRSGTWELCRDIGFRDCRTFRSDERDLQRLRGWNDTVSSLRRVGGSDRPAIEVFEHYDYEGESRTFDQAVDDLQSQRWNDRISSVRVLSGRWQICRHNGYRECREIGGDESRLDRGWNDAISSMRPLRPFRED